MRQPTPLPVVMVVIIMMVVIRLFVRMVNLSSVCEFCRVSEVKQTPLQVNFFIARRPSSANSLPPKSCHIFAQNRHDTLKKIKKQNIFLKNTNSSGLLSKHFSAHHDASGPAIPITGRYHQRLFGHDIILIQNLSISV